MATHLSKMKWKEISGVDGPANESPGWLLQKSAEFGDAVEAFEKSIVGLHESLGGEASKLYFKDAPEDVQKAVEKVYEHLDGGLEDDESTEDGEPVEKSTLIDGLRKAFKKKSKAADEEDAEDGGSDDDEEDENGKKLKKDSESEESNEEDESSEDEDESETSDESGEDADETVEKSEKLVKDIASVFDDRLQPVIDAVGAIADRTDALEKHAAGRKGLPGQEVSASDEDDEGGPSSLEKAFLAAAQRPGEKLNLT